MFKTAIEKSHWLILLAVVVILAYSDVVYAVEFGGMLLTSITSG